MEPNRQPLGGQPPAGPLGPLDEQRTFVERVLEAELVELRGVAQAIEVGMGHGEGGQLVALDEREGRTRDLDRRAGERSDQGAGDFGFAAAELALEGDEVARPQERGEARRQLLGRSPARQVDDEVPFALNSDLNSDNAPACTAPRSARRCRRPAWA